MGALRAVGHALETTGSMTWEILWALVFGFALSALLQAVVRRSTIERHLGDDGPRAVAVATLAGAASSSCSYAAVALARALVRKGASFTAALAFEIASTNLVVELGIVLAVLVGWQFTVGEFAGGPVMIVVVALACRRFLGRPLAEAARAQAELGLAGSMEGHAAMDMSIDAPGGPWRRLRSPGALSAVSRVFVMEWAAVLRDVALGLVVAGAVAAWVPTGFWHHFFFTGHPGWTEVWGPLVGPVIAMASFVCSVGNVPLAAVLWNAGMSFGGVVSFVFADLLILPVVVIHRRYYGTRMALFVLATYYGAIVVAGYVVELVFAGTGLVPAGRHARVAARALHWDLTSALDMVALVLALVLVVRFVRSGGLPMLKEMGGAPGGAGHAHHDGAAGDAHKGARPGPLDGPAGGAHPGRGKAAPDAHD
ncbi:MAG TPA: permease [Acidimicrobiales bacterium]|nr:permease [Acidimicrobiales bacterium]